MTRDEYHEAREFIDGLGYTCPDPSALIRGAICGSVEVVDVVSKSDSPWFFGPRGQMREALGYPIPNWVDRKWPRKLRAKANSDISRGKRIAPSWGSCGLFH